MVEPFLAIRAATIENFWRGQKSLLATIVTSSMRSQPWCDFLAMISLPTVVDEPFSKWGWGTSARQKSTEDFSKRFPLTMDPILIVFKHI